MQKMIYYSGVDLYDQQSQKTQPPKAPLVPTDEAIRMWKAAYKSWQQSMTDLDADEDRFSDLIRARNEEFRTDFQRENGLTDKQTAYLFEEVNYHECIAEWFLAQLNYLNDTLDSFRGWERACKD